MDLCKKGLVSYEQVPGGVAGTREWIKLDTSAQTDTEQCSRIDRLFKEMSANCKHREGEACTYKENTHKMCIVDKCPLIIRRK